jgi:hypothetical protein
MIELNGAASIHDTYDVKSEASNTTADPKY